MNEEEIIQYLEKMEKEYKQFGDLQNPDYEDEDKIHKAIQGLLDLYNQEKEKNKKLLKDNKELNDYINGMTIATGIALNGRTIEVSKKTLYELENTIKIEQVYIPETDSYRFRAM